MVQVGIGSTDFVKSVRSLVDTFTSFEKEAEVIFEKMGVKAPAAMVGQLRRLAVGAVSDQGSGYVKKLFGLATAAKLPAVFSTGNLAALLGVADERSLQELRLEVRDALVQVSQLREREVAFAGGLSQLRARSGRFENALAGLARVQGKCLSLQQRWGERSEGLEQLAARRDEHITRLIRDTTSQRAGLEKLSSRLDELGSALVETRSAIATSADKSALEEQLRELETRLADFRKIQSNGTHRTVESLDLIRERLSRLEARTAEVSREARIKTGRLDALARHVASVDGRLSNAIGKTRPGGAATLSGGDGYAGVAG
ncbi:MAG: hypothetical protein ACE5E4_00660 [Candidatus Binatia bacterium]